MKIVSLCPSLTELVFALDRGDDLVGVTSFCVRPADRVAAIEKVGGTKRPDVARIAALAPDLVLMNEEENRVEDNDALVEAGLRCHVTFPKDPSDAAAMVRDVGEAIDRSDAASRLADEIEDRLARLRAPRPPVRYAYLIWKKPLMTIGDDTYIGGLLDAAGGENAFGGRGDRYPTLEPRDLRDADPDAVYLSTEPFPFEEKHRDELAAECGLPVERFCMVDGRLLSWHGASTPAGLDYAASLVAASREGT